MAQGQIRPTAWVYKVLLNLCIYTSFMDGCFRATESWAVMIEIIWLARLKIFAIQPCTKKVCWLYTTVGYFSSFQKTVPMSSSHKDPVHGGSTIWNIEAYCGAGKGGPENLPLGIKPFTQETHFTPSLTPLAEASDMAAPVPRWPEECPPMCPGGEQALMRTVATDGL